MSAGQAAARFLANSPARTALLGAGIGAAAGGLQRPPEGGSRLRGAMRGAAVGGVAGGLVGGTGRGLLDTRLLANRPLSATEAVTGTLRRAGTGLANFGKRQVHGLTGHYDHDAIGMAGNRASATKVDLLNRRKAYELHHAPAARHADIEKSYAGEIAGELKAGRESQRLADAGVTNLRGMGRALATPGQRGPALRAMGRSLVYGSGGPVLSLAVPAALYGPSLLRGDESAMGGQTLGQKARSFGANMGVGAALGGMPLVSQMVVGEGLNAAGRGLSRLRRRAPPQVHAGEAL